MLGREALLEEGQQLHLQIIPRGELRVTAFRGEAPEYGGSERGVGKGRVVKVFRK